MTLLSAGTGIGISFQGSGAKTYADFQAHIATLAVDGVKVWANNAGTMGAGRFRTTTATPSEALRGSSWNSFFQNGTNNSPDRAVQHGFASQAAFDAQVAAGREVYFQTTVGASSSSWTGVDRNGYLSESSVLTRDRVSMIDLIYWDGTQAQRLNPSTGTGPTPYVF